MKFQIVPTTLRTLNGVVLHLQPLVTADHVQPKILTRSLQESSPTEAGDQVRDFLRLVVILSNSSLISNHLII
jgi:hypothetical protein